MIPVIRMLDYNIIKFGRRKYCDITFNPIPHRNVQHVVDFAQRFAFRASLTCNVLCAAFVTVLEVGGGVTDDFFTLITGQRNKAMLLYFVFYDLSRHKSVAQHTLDVKTSHVRPAPSRTKTLLSFAFQCVRTLVS